MIQRTINDEENRSCLDLNLKQGSEGDKVKDN
jgi:hypothetical protein